MKARAMQAFHAEQKGEISLAVGDLILVREQCDDGWWEGSIGARHGIFPGAFCKLMPEWELEEVRPPPAALRFGYDGAKHHEHATLHGLAAKYEGLFRLAPDREVNGRPAWRHVDQPKQWIAFNGSGWMAQNESALGTETGVMLLRDGGCADPSLSDKSWKVTPGWKVERGLRCIAMTADEADTWEENANPWGEGAAADAALGAMAAELARHPDVRLARDKQASTAERLAAMDRLTLASGGAGGGGGVGGDFGALMPPPSCKQPLQLAAPGGKNGSRSGAAQRSAQQELYKKHAALAPAGPPGGGIVEMRGGILFVGSTDDQRRPHGGGELILLDGSVHVGLFEHGAAHGEGVYYDCRGSVHCGSWAANLRVGHFEVVDPAGGSFDDVYDASGQRTSRKRVTPAGVAATRCRHCSVRFHEAHNFKCRKGAAGGSLAAGHEEEFCVEV